MRSLSLQEKIKERESFSWEHRPEQAVEAAPEQNTTCLICLDLVGDRKSYSTMVCPACKHAWFHRGLSERHSRCDASECLCPGGREQAEKEGPWQLLLCCSCAAEGTHRRCSYSRNSTARWECNSCAGRGTGRRQSTRVALDWGQGPGKAWQWVPRLGLAEPLCSRRAGATALAYPAPGLGGRDLDLPASPYSLQCQLTACRPQYHQPGGIGAVSQISGTGDQHPPRC
ncbi:uncharacterized protein J5F26_010205 [Ciconia maguari]